MMTSLMDIHPLQLFRSTLVDMKEHLQAHAFCHWEQHSYWLLTIGRTHTGASFRLRQALQVEALAQRNAVIACHERKSAKILGGF